MANSDQFERQRRAVKLAVATGTMAISAVCALWICATVGTLGADLSQVTLDNAIVPVSVPTYARTLGVGSTITEQDLVMTVIAREYLPEDALRSPQAAIGRVLLERALVGDLVREERMAPPAIDGGLHALVPRGMRAQSLEIKGAPALSGFVEPGNKVDVLVTIPDEEDAEHGETVTLASGVPVLAVNERISETVAGEPVLKSQITVVVTPAESERLTHVTAIHARITLTLRSDLDDAPTAAVAPVDRIGRPRRQLTVAEYRERVTDEDLAAMEARMAPPEIAVANLAATAPELAVVPMGGR
ncbi:MAG: Flp pilus assembly protein CpaB [Myxococcota bacterium]